MVAILLILRPQPGADSTAARAKSMGLETRVAPLFVIRPVAWEVPDAGEHDAILLTSANAAREAGPQLAALTHLPCYAVGEASAEAAAEAGFETIRAGPSDGRALLEMAADEGVKRLLHLCGRDHIGLEDSRLRLTRRVVYAAEPVSELPREAVEALSQGAVALLHSPRAGALFAELVDEAGLDRRSIAIAAISPAAAAAAGGGWKQEESAAIPRDEALLELASKLCQTKPRETGNGG